MLALLRRDAPGDDYSIKVVSAPEGRHFSEPVLFNIRTRLFSEIDGFAVVTPLLGFYLVQHLFQILLPFPSVNYDRFKDSRHVKVTRPTLRP